MDSTSLVSALALSPAAARQQASGVVRSLVEGPQVAAAVGLGFAEQSLQTALTTANLLTLMGGDGKSVLRQARGAVAAAAGAVGTLSRGVASDAADGLEPGGTALQQLGGLGLVVGNLGSVVEAVIDAPSSTRAVRREHGPDRDVTAMRADLQAMSGALAGGTIATLDLTV
jgi:hypothetical protein